MGLYSEGLQEVPVKITPNFSWRSASAHPLCSLCSISSSTRRGNPGVCRDRRPKWAPKAGQQLPTRHQAWPDTLPPAPGPISTRPRCPAAAVQGRGGVQGFCSYQYTRPRAFCSAQKFISWFRQAGFECPRAADVSVVSDRLLLAGTLTGAVPALLL